MGEVISEALSGGGSRLRAPELLNRHHDRASFDSSTPILGEWLRETAIEAEGLSARTFVVCAGRTVVGYYCLAMGGIIRSGLPTTRLRKNLPDPVPGAIIGRLAVDHRYQGQRIGAGLLKDAILRTINVSREVGCRAVLVHALSEDAASFYRKYGFLQCREVDHRTLILPLETAIKAFG